MPGAAGRERQGAAVPTHVLPPLPREHRVLAPRTALPRVSRARRLRRRRFTGQHPARAPPGRPEAPRARAAVRHRVAPWYRGPGLAQRHAQLSSQGLCMLRRFTGDSR